MFESLSERLGSVVSKLRNRENFYTAGLAD
jgi:hypothetical protein